MQSDIYSIEEGRFRLAVDAKLGAHLVEYSIDGRNSLATDRPEIGSTFWPSPQHAWGWPPPHTLDKAPYAAKREGNRLVFVSEVCPQTGLRLRKEFALRGGIMTARYRMTNASSNTVHFAPWEITRLMGGVTFYESDVEPLAQTTGGYLHEEGVVWHEYVPAVLTQHTKLFGVQSRGWLANACDDLLLVKRFAPLDVKDAAPSEAEIEIYAHCDVDNPYIEMEQQGRYQAIAPQASVDWEVDWLLARLPEEVEVLAGDPALVRQVHKLLTR